METTDFEDILRDAADEVTALDPANLDSAEFLALRRAARRRLEWCWEFHYWPDLGRVEQRWFRPFWDAAETYDPGDQVYFPATDKYYQALQPVEASADAPPAVLDDGEYVLNDVFWIECAAEYNGDDWDSTVTYEVGDIVRNPDDGLFYAKLAGLSASGAGSSAVNVDYYLLLEDVAGKPFYASAVSGAPIYTMNWNGAFWSVLSSGPSVTYYTSGEDVATPDLVVTWTPVTGIAPGPTLTSQGTPTGSPALWGVLVPFDRYAAYEQEGETAIGIVAAAWNRNPRISTRGTELNWFLSQNGVQVLSNVTSAWIDYRVRCPKINGNLFDSTGTYEDGDQVYFSSTGTAGNFYIANQATAAGQSPDTHASKWDVVEIPRIFHEPLVHALAAEWIKGPGGGAPQDAAMQLTLAQAALDDQKSLLVGQQSQRIKTVVRTR